ncbi:hypothetical protein HMPREF0891_0449 [Lactobacillus crispatus 214-1]|nr:hypothetical protein HMPREF0891_0449 [Lactobacillus crispatus 214-1]
MGLNFYVQFKKDSSKTNTQIVRWLTIVIFAKFGISLGISC